MKGKLLNKETQMFCNILCTIHDIHTSPTSYITICPSESPTAISLPECVHLTRFRAGLPSTAMLAVGTCTSLKHIAKNASSFHKLEITEHT